MFAFRRNPIKHSRRLIYKIIWLSVLLVVLVVAALRFIRPAVAVNRTWDGGGATNNWSEAANWSGDTVPVTNDTVIFDGSLGAASLKDCTIDAAGPQGANINISGISISGSYTGTISVNSDVSPTIKGTSSQATGVFNCGSSLVKFEQGTFTLNGGSFNCATGNLQLKDDITLTLNGGTFNAPTGLMSFIGAGNQTLNITSTATFNHNNGSVSFAALFANINLNGGSAGTQEFNNLTFATSSNINLGASDTVRVLGTLALNGGRISQGILEVPGNMSVGSGFIGGGSGSGLLRIVGPTARTITLASGLSEPMPRIELDAPNVTLNTSGAGTVQLHSFNLKQGVVDTGTANVSLGLAGSFRNSSQSGGAFNCGGGSVLFDTANFTLDGGSFNCTNGNLEFRTGDALTLNGGTFDAPGPNFTMSFTNPSFNSNGALIIGAGATFNHNNGTISFGNSLGMIDINAASAGTRDLNNLTIATTSNFSIGNGDTVRVLGNLALNGGRYTQGTLESRSGLSVGSGFIGGSGGLLRIAGLSARTISLPGGLAEVMPPMEVDAPNVQINMSGASELKINTLNLIQGVIDNGTTPVSFGNAGSIRSSSQSGGTFNCGGGVVKFASSNYTLSGGSFNCANSNIEVVSFGTLQLDGGTFNAPAGPGGILSFTTPGFNTVGNLNINTGVTFNHNNGTISFGTDNGTITLNGAANATREVFNLIENAPSRLSVSSGDTIRILNNLSINLGGVAGSYEVQGNVTVASGVSAEAGSITFTGTNNQTFTNNGGANPTGIWNIDKPSGTVTAATSLILGTSQTLNIKSGTLFLNNSSNLTVGTLAIGDSSVSTKLGKLTNNSSTTITIGSTVQFFNNSVIDLQGGGVACPESDSILIRSSVNGTRRNWTGQGIFKLVDVDVRDMGGSNATLPSIKVFSGTNTGNNNTNWIFDNNCPPTPTISPSEPSVLPGNFVQFSAGGGTAPFSWSLAVNNSGATINPSTGLYTAGLTFAVNDTVRVTDSLGQTADAVVHVTPPPTRLVNLTPPPPEGFVSLLAGQVITPSITIAVQDAFGNTVTTANNPVTVIILNNPGGSTLSGTVTKNAVNGIATFNDLSLNRTGDVYVLLAQSPQLDNGLAGFYRVSPNVPNQVVFLTQPTDTRINTPMTPAASISLQDAFGNNIFRDSSSMPPITVGLANNPAQMNFPQFEMNSWPSSVPIFFSNPGDGYTLVASFNGITKTSNAFNITARFEVTNTNDSGPGSLREAIQLSNGAQGPNPSTITFNIPGAGSHTIAPLTNLPEINHATVIDGTTQPGFAGSPIIELSGANVGTGTGLSFSHGKNTVKGLVINRWFAGIRFNEDPTIIQGNYIGTNVSGTASLGNQIGVFVTGSPVNNSLTNLIGGATAAHRNVISGNGVGIKSQGNVALSVQGNYIGTDASGQNAVPNTRGIEIITVGTTIGGVNPNEGNTIAFNTNQGINFTSFSSSIVRGNSIHSNGSLGVDRYPEGVNPRGGQDSSPLLTSVSSSNNSTTISGNYNSPSPTASPFQIDFYSSPTCDSSGTGEGKTFLGSTSVPPVSSVAPFSATLPVPTTSGHKVTAIITDPSLNSSSEFSPCLAVGSSLFNISGKTRDNAFANVPSTVVQLTGTVNATTMTDVIGNYVFENLPSGGNYTISVSKVNYNFTPSSLTLTNLSASQTNQDFVGTRTNMTVSGITLATINGATFPIPGVSINLSGAAGRTATSNPVYVMTGLAPGSYTITPSLDGYSFSPASTDVTLTNTDQVRNFTATPVTSPLEGRFVFRSSDIGTVNADGTAYTHTLVQGANASSVRLSNNGHQIRYTTLKKICSVGADGIGNSCIDVSLPGAGDIQSTAWTADESKIVFKRSGVQGLFVMGPSGQNVTQVPLGNFNATAGSPSWLSNTRIVFSAKDNNDFEIYAVNIDGSNIAKLTNNTVNDHYPVASPDGTRVAFFRTGSTYTLPDKLMVLTLSNNSEQQLSDKSLGNAAWSPDGNRVAFTERLPNTDRLVAVNADSGNGKRVIANGVYGQVSWGPKNEVATNPGSNVTVTSGSATITFGGVGSAGTTTITSIPFGTAGTVPNGFAVGTFAFELSTTASYTAPVTVCFRNLPYTDSQIAALSLMHNENGVLVDRTTSRNFPNKEICGSVTTLSPFALAEQIGAGSSITGLVQDNLGNGLADVTIQLTGTETRVVQTDAFGVFQFVNLTPGNYTIHPTLPGYVFSESSRDLIGLSGNGTAIFIGTRANFNIGGKATDELGNPLSDVQIDLTGALDSHTSTDVNGNYSFTDLPANNSFSVTAFKEDIVFSPSVAVIPQLTNSQTSIDFVTAQPAPTPTPTPTPVPTPESLNYVALGDSITFGLGDSQGGFATRYQNDLQLDLSLPVSTGNRAVPGLTSSALLNSLHNDQVLRNLISSSRVVTFNIGGNDLLPVIDKYQFAQCGGSDNLDCMRTAMTLLKSNLTGIVNELLLLRSTNDTVIRTMDIYNPFVLRLKSKDSWPNDGGLNDFQAIKPFADDINNYIVTLAAMNRIPCARVSIGFNGPHNDEDADAKGLIAPDGIHPNSSGHALIADLFRAAAYAPLVQDNSSPKVQIAVGDYAVKESTNVVTASVVRTGNPNTAITIDYATADGSASEHGDYIAAFGRLSFAPGELVKTLPILIVNDVNNESDETFTLTLSSASGGVLITPTTTNIVITNDDSGVQQPNPVDDARFFAEEHYFDFLNRFPDQSGWDFWTNEITSCGSNQSCTEVKRINVSAAFFLSIEFQETGYLIERLYKTAYGDATGTSTLGGSHPLPVPVVRLNEFLADTHDIGFGLVVGQPGWEQVLENNKVRFMDEFVLRTRFTQALPLTLTPAQFVDQLNANAGNPLSQQQRDQLMSELTTGAKTRAQVLRVVAEDADLKSAEFNRAFVLMQYFGYLRRNPNDLPDSDFTGYDFWLTKLNQFNGNFVNAEMVKAFIASTEYRQRFGP